jgi:hypothetical protein
VDPLGVFCALLYVFFFFHKFDFGLSIACILRLEIDEFSAYKRSTYF